MSREKEYRCLDEFISLYENERCLWKMKAPDYHDRKKKDVAYGRLVEKWKEVEPSATRSTVLRKINNLRSSYRKELKKIRLSIKSGSSAGVYVPKLWYFNRLKFLDELEKDRSNCNETTDNEEESHTAASCDQVERLGHEDENESIQTAEVRPTNSEVSFPVCKAESRQKTATISFQPAIDTNSLRKEVLMTVKDHFKQPHKQEDRFDMFGKIVAAKLRDLDDDQRRFAEKFINDVLFEAEGGNLDTAYAFVRQVPLGYE